MIEINDAIYAALAGDSELVAILGSAAISGQWPVGDETFSVVPAGVSDYATLPAVDPPRGRVTFVLIAPSNDGVTDIHVDSYQIDFWSLSERINDAAARRTPALLTADRVQPTTAHVTEAWVTDGPDLYETDTRLFHKVLYCDVTWIGA